MSLRINWNEAKSKMEKAGVDVKLFSKDLGPLLDDYESADRKYQAASGKDPKKVDEVRTERKTAAAKGLAAAATYGDSIRYLNNHAKDPKQKVTLDAALTTLMGIINTLNKGK